MPRDRRDIRKAWDDIPTVRRAVRDKGTSAAAKIPPELLYQPVPGETPDHGEVRLKNGARLVPLDEATLPDFTEYYEATLMNPKVLVGIFLGAMSTFVFCALTMKAVGRAAKGMVEEVRRQFRENKGIMEGKTQPDYARPVEISTKAAQREMVLPSILG